MAKAEGCSTLIHDFFDSHTTIHLFAREIYSSPSRSMMKARKRRVHESRQLEWKRKEHDAKEKKASKKKASSSKVNKAASG